MALLSWYKFNNNIKNYGTEEDYDLNTNSKILYIDDYINLGNNCLYTNEKDLVIDNFTIEFDVLFSDNFNLEIMFDKNNFSIIINNEKITIGNNIFNFGLINKSFNTISIINNQTENKLKCYINKQKIKEENTYIKSKKNMLQLKSNSQNCFIKNFKLFNQILTDEQIALKNLNMMVIIDEKNNLITNEFIENRSFNINMVGKTYFNSEYSLTKGNSIYNINNNSFNDVWEI